MSIGAVVLAAGQGTRMRSSLPKVAHTLAGRPMVRWVLDALEGAGVERTVVVVGHGAEVVRDALPQGVEIAVQEEQLGTGHAAQVGLASLDPACDTVVVACGDTPLLPVELVGRLVSEHAAEPRAATMLTAVVDDAGSYGRVVRDGDRRVARVVEARDASPDELAIGEYNAGLYVFDRAALEDVLARLDSSNAQGEIYLTDALERLEGPVAALVADDPEAAAGVNDRVDLAACEAALQQRLREELMRGGVTMPDPSAVYVDAGVTVGRDTLVLPGTHLRGATTIGEGCVIGPDVVLTDCVIGDGCSMVSVPCEASARLEDGAEAGPFAYLGRERSWGRGAGRHVRRDEEQRARRARQGAAPFVHRGRA